MTDSHDLHRFLKDSGYLRSPADRLLWRGALPTLRHHLRQLILLAFWAALPISLLMVGLTSLDGADRLMLLVFYVGFMLVVFACFDLVMGFLVHLRRLERFWSRATFINALPVPLAVAFLLFSGLHLRTLIIERGFVVTVFAWTVLALAAWIAAQSLRLLLVSRLYWHGIRPPRYRPRSILMAVSLALLLFILAGLGTNSRALPDLEPHGGSPLLMLAFDVPEPLFADYAARVAEAPMSPRPAPETHITDFWTSLGTGAPPRHHRASLVRFQTPVFKTGLNREDPTQAIPVMLLRRLGLAEPLARGGRYRKYFWEILDQYGLRTHAYAFWHTFPANSQNGAVLSERWSEQLTGEPYASGLTMRRPEEKVRLLGGKALRAAIQRENQVWAQLMDRAAAADFDLCVAYFPLADMFARLPETLRQSRQQTLLDHRDEQLDALRSRLDADTKVVVVFTTGMRTAGAGRLHWSLTAAPAGGGMSELGHLGLAPFVLNHFGLPPDRMMAGSSHNPRAPVDYGEPNLDPVVDATLDAMYYQELKSLGYLE